MFNLKKKHNFTNCLYFYDKIFFLILNLFIHMHVLHTIFYK